MHNTNSYPCFAPINDNESKILSLFQIQECLPFQEEGSDTLEPLLADVCMFCFNNMETFRSEVEISKLCCNEPMKNFYDPGVRM